MELIPITATVHYKAAFDITADSDELITELRKVIRSWCLNLTKEQDNTELHGRWFFGGVIGEKKVGSYQFRVATNTAIGFEVTEPSHWALEVIHPDAEYKARRWSVEITLTQQPGGSIRFVSIVKNWIREGYIGAAPEQPMFSTPNYIKKIIGNRSFVCQRGSTVITNHPTVITEQNCSQIVAEIISPDRYLPLVVISKDKFNEQKYCINYNKLQRKVLGNANIYLLESEDVADLLNDSLGYDYSCFWGAMRVYMNKVDVTKPQYSHFHRYYSSNIAEEKIIEEITVGLSRNMRTFITREVLSLQHVLHERQRTHLQNLRDNKVVLSEEQDAWFAEMESELVEKEQLAAKLANVTKDIESREQENIALQYEIEGLKHCLEGSSVQSTEDTNLAEAVKNLEELPEDLSDVVKLIAKLYPARIKFTKEGRKSAKNYKYSRTVVADSWKILRAMAIELHPLFFSNKKSVDIERKFKNSTGYELSMKEGPQTSKDPSLCKLRKIIYKKEEVDITPHVKFGTREPRLLRVHFYPDQDEKLLIVGHCGSHLDNYSTKNRS